MEWIESQGGPLLVVEESLLLLWEGADAPSEGRLVQAESRASPAGIPTDYDRACDVRRVIGQIEIGGHPSLVLAGEPLPSTWWPDPTQNGGTIVRWRYANSEDEIANALAGVSNELFMGQALHMSVNEPLVMFDAAMPGHDIVSPHLRFEISHGQYAVQTATYEPDSSTSLLLHRFVRS
jgi:hypothetical protein